MDSVRTSAPSPPPLRPPSHALHVASTQIAADRLHSTTTNATAKRHQGSQPQKGVTVGRLQSNGNASSSGRPQFACERAKAGSARPNLNGHAAGNGQAGAPRPHSNGQSAARKDDAYRDRIAEGPLPAWMQKARAGICCCSWPEFAVSAFHF